MKTPHVLCAFTLGLALVTTTSLPARAQEPVANYPSRAVEFVVPFAAGGSADVIARLVENVFVSHVVPQAS